MSNSLAIATVTAALRQLLDTPARNAVTQAVATPGRPKDISNGVPDPEINIYLYRVVPNPAWSNADLPTRRPDGSLAERPQVALDLHYLLTFYGDETKYEPQRLMGAAVSTLQAQPVLTRGIIESTIASVTLIADSNLTEQLETVRFTPLALDLEELSKLWSVFFQTAYSLSIAYQASVVLIEAEATPQPSLPVQARHVYGRPFRQPAIEGVSAQAGTGQPIVAGSRLSIRGQRLQGEVTKVRIGDVEAEPVLVSDRQVSLPLPPGLRAGVQGAQVIHQILMGDPPQPHRGFESNVAAFILQPTVTSATAPTSTETTVALSPKVGRRQRVALFLNELAPPADRPARAYGFDAPPENGITDSAIQETASITFALEGVHPGDYLVRVQVDGAESPLTADASGRYTEPKVSIP